MKLLHTLKNYLCYCGIEKEEYDKIKKAAYVSNFMIWRTLHCFMTAVFAALFIGSLLDGLLHHNSLIYLCYLLYAIVTSICFFIMKEDSLIAQFWIYLSISLLLLLGCFLTLTNLEHPSTTFIVMLLITPLFMVDKPFFMGIEIAIASVVYLFWMHAFKAPSIWKMDLINITVFAVSGFFIHIVSNSLRIKEFVLTRRINIQKDTDELTGLKNKSAITKEINEFLLNEEKNKGILFVLDIDRFKAINDTYGHDVGDSVISQLGAFLNGYFKNGETVGRFGGDEFIFFKKDTDDERIAEQIAKEIVSGVVENISLPDRDKKTSASIGIALYHGEEKNYSELFKKADTALYDVKSKRTDHYKIFR
ncbi:MAG: GGDEF domain-containing protein [Clostridia bacterium]|nr:GGDEF domain-containing protein [Clostridia bacterium]